MIPLKWGILFKAESFRIRYGNDQLLAKCLFILISGEDQLIETGVGRG